MNYITEIFEEKDFKIADADYTADMLIDEDEDWGIIRAFKDLKSDIKKVTAKETDILHKKDKLKKDEVIIAGSIGNSRDIDSLIEKGKLDVEGVEGRWESFVIQVIDNPFEGIKRALVIAGSDKRGTIYGIYDLSQKIGVSPWYWWADVPVKKRSSIYVESSTYKQGEPSVKYRGIFLNDEAPCLSTWVEDKFSGFNHDFYEKVFELLLRLKANYLWPAMWQPRIFNAEDPLNPVIADKYGIVMGTSHHEPMMRSWVEWGVSGKGEWNYAINKNNLYKFWEEGLKRVKDYEGIVTVGMRGDGDEPMLEDADMEERQALLEKIIRDQREIIDNTIDAKLSEVPQLLALYKEVQAFYENGLDVPEDVTLLLADDNFANIRLLPGEDERKRSGGFGMYYHFDYVGGPRTYQWINTVPIQKIWEQMNMTYHYGVDRIWIVNVGDLKPMEFPISFFMEMALDIDKWNHENVNNYAEKWAEEIFGREYAADTAEILNKYTKYNGRRKPELIEEETYSLINYREAERVLKEFNFIVKKAEKIYEEIEEKKDAFFQLVLYPARASRNMLKMHVYAGRNKLYAKQGRAAANDYADKVKEIFENEAEDSRYYNEELSGGKWKGMMIQPHIGKSNWRGPEKNEMPEFRKIVLKPGSDIGVVTEGSCDVLTDVMEGKLPQFSRFDKDKYYFEIFNKGQKSFEFKITADRPWIRLSKDNGRINKQERIWVDIDWDILPEEESLTGSIKINALGSEIKIRVNVFNPVEPKIDKLKQKTFVESSGYISIEAEHYQKKNSVNDASWQKIDDYGRTLSSMFAYPPNLKSFTGKQKEPFLEYGVYLYSSGRIKVKVYTAPSLNIDRNRGLCYGISFDENKAVIIDTFPKKYDAHHSCNYWAEGVKDNVRITESVHHLEKSGYHKLRIWMVDPGIVLQKIVLDMGGVEQSYLGPPESFYKK